VISRSDSSATFATMDSSYSIKWNRLYRASEHEFSASDFHRLCDNKGPTVVLVKAENGRMAAGYSSVSWKTRNTAEANPYGFLCAIDSNDFSLKLYKGAPGECIILQRRTYGPYFYEGFSISHSCNKDLSSHSAIGS
jgi:hypothetical protein